MLDIKFRPLTLLLFLFFISLCIPQTSAAQDAFYGGITPPAFLSPFVAAGPGGGIVLILRIILRLILIGAGFFAVFQFLSAGLIFMSSDGDPQKLAKGRNKLILTLVGLAVIASSFVIAALIGIIFFGDAGALISPTITGAGIPTPTPPVGP
jgi:hypothetical protein